MSTHHCATIVSGIRHTKLSSQVMEKMGSNVVVKERSQDLHLSSSYETAMEALSSLITRQKRGDKSNICGKYGKLDRMLMYLKVTMLHISQFYGITFNWEEIIFEFFEHFWFGMDKKTCIYTIVTLFHEGYCLIGCAFVVIVLMVSLSALKPP